MAKFEKYCEVCSRFEDIADFITVYIGEIHPIGEWEIVGNYSIPKHDNLKDRQAAAKILLEKNTQAVNHNVLLDFMDDNANKAYGVSTDRLYVIKDGICIFQTDLGPIGYDIDKLSNWLQHYKLQTIKN